ncbi:MAG: HAD hydrolase-like protein [Corynebacterium sp.]|uniref:HAD hydrolase-like protein n=1 Tax=Corynebacterium sp. TaxID=1720 RepID=UPI0026DCC082|nr:HAD hydrolase-like protein [Corynebacterium sp.]MDO5029723.1 HAD hydrolase-like protein [Corynebacterium sp.]
MSTGHSPTVLIDVDGTIADSLPAIAHGFRLALEAIDHPIPPTSFINTIPGPPMVETLASLGLSDEQVDRAFSVYMENQHAGAWKRAEMFPGWPELLHNWREAGVRLATATSKGEYFARKTLDNFGLLDAFDFIGAASDDGTRQQKVDVIAHTLDSLGIARNAADRPKGAVVMVGDRIHDFEGAAQFGIPAIAVEWGYGQKAELDQAAAIAASPEELDRVVREMLYL